MVAIFAFLAMKAGFILKALKALKYAKFVITAVTMSLSAILYGFAFGSWYFAAGFVLLLLVHEYGHVVAMWRKGMAASAPIFIPFFGAAIFAEIPKNRNDEAFIGYGGPLIGTIGALGTIGAAFLFPAGSFWSTLLHVLGNVGLFINLFNLIPVRPLDGGRILHPLGNWVSYVGFFILAGLAVMLNDIFFVAIALFAVQGMPLRPFIVDRLWALVFVSIATRILTRFSTGILGYAIAAVLIVGAIIFVILSIKRRINPAPERLRDDGASFLVRIKWLAYYVGLLAILVTTMVWHTDHLPKEVRESSMVRFIHEF
jgi:Zn-dependent protease